MTEVNQTYCGDHFSIYINAESSYCTPETNIILYVNDTSFKKERKFAEYNKKSWFVWGEYKFMTILHGN